MPFLGWMEPPPVIDWSQLKATLDLASCPANISLEFIVAKVVKQ